MIIDFVRLFYKRILLLFLILLKKKRLSPENFNMVLLLITTENVKQRRFGDLTNSDVHFPELLIYS